MSVQPSPTPGCRCGSTPTRGSRSSRSRATCCGATWRTTGRSCCRRLSRKHLALTPTEPYVDAGTPDPATLDEIVAAAPIPLDGSQAEAVAAARAGRTFVLEGPPGTGKSQTITNLIADQVARGRSVLFVAEKGAALEVVRSRLESVGLLPFMLDLHDRNARPLAVRKQLKRALAYVPEVDTTTYGMAAGDTRSAGTVLADYAGQLHERNAAGLSLYEAHELRLARGDGPDAGRPRRRRRPARDVSWPQSPTSTRLGPDTWRHWGFASDGDPADDPGDARLGGPSRRAGTRSADARGAGRRSDGARRHGPARARRPGAAAARPTAPTRHGCRSCSRTPGARRRTTSTPGRTG